VVLQAEIKKRTDAGDYMGMFSLMKDQANVIKQAMNEENQRYGVVVLRFGLLGWCLFWEYWEWVWLALKTCCIMKAEACNFAVYETSNGSVRCVCLAMRILVLSCCFR
jgi:hypothetical protein